MIFLGRVIIFQYRKILVGTPQFVIWCVMNKTKFAVFTFGGGCFSHDHMPFWSFQDISLLVIKDTLDVLTRLFLELLGTFWGSIFEHMKFSQLYHAVEIQPVPVLQHSFMPFLYFFNFLRSTQLPLSKGRITPVGKFIPSLGITALGRLIRIAYHHVFIPTLAALYAIAPCSKWSTQLDLTGDLSRYSAVDLISLLTLPSWTVTECSWKFSLSSTWWIIVIHQAI